MNHTELNDIATRIISIDEQVSSLEKIKAALQLQLIAAVGVWSRNGLVSRHKNFDIQSVGCR